MEEIIYKQTEKADLKLFTFRPKDSNCLSPAIVFFHGSAWVTGSPEQFFPHCEHLAKRGFVAMSASYRLNKSTGSSPFDCVIDGRSAVRYIKTHAEELGIDPDRLIVSGASAGGHVAVCTMLMDEINDPEDDLNVSTDCSAFILFNPVLDTTATGWKGGPDQLGDRCRELSPIHHLRKGLPPTVIFHGEEDGATPYANTRDFADKMNEFGDQCEVFSYKGMDHGFFNHGMHDNKPYHDTLSKIDAFLANLMKMKPI